MAIRVRKRVKIKIRMKMMMMMMMMTMKKDGFIIAHISKDSAAAILAAHVSIDSMWETTDDDNIGLMVGKEDLVCCHFNVPHFKESEE